MIAELAAALALASAPAAELEPAGSSPLPGGATVYRFQQAIGGVEVAGAETVVADPAGGPPALVADSTLAAVERPSRPRVTRAGALRAALGALGPRRLARAPRAELVIEPRLAGRPLVWLVAVASDAPLADHEVAVDALRGEVLRVRDLARRFRTGQARLFDPNPPARQGSYDGLRSDRGDSDTPRLTRLRVPVGLARILERQSCLRGRWAHAVLYRDEVEVCRRSLDWRRVKRSSDRFEALMAYFHVDRAQQYLRSLGLGLDVNAERQLLRVNAISDDNSYFRPSQEDITYGTGGVDDAEDADVIWHEYGHAIQDDQVPGFGRGWQAGAIGEGFGDYLSATMTFRSPGLPEYPGAAQCVFDWDGISYPPDSPCGRRADRGWTLQFAETRCWRQIHCVGMVWSSALLDLRQALGLDGQGRSVLDRDLIASQELYVRRETFADAAQALLYADAMLYPSGGTHQAAIQAEMEQRGIL